MYLQISSMKLSVAIILLMVAAGSANPILEYNQNPDKMSGEFEGDILLDESQKIKHGTTDRKKYWPNATMFYKFSPGQGDFEKQIILKAINEYHTRTCLRIVERTDEKNYVLFTPHHSSCSSMVRMQGGEQNLNLAIRCYTKSAGIIIHELLHAFGFWHEQSAHNRDDYVTINFQNMDESVWHNFQKYDSSDVTDFKVGYDYASIMHYSRKAGSNNGLDTITPKDPNAVIGQQDGLSGKDILKLQKMYGCQQLAMP